MAEPWWEQLLRALGFNPVRLRWKIRSWQARRERRERARDNERRAIHYEHKVCPGCGLTVDRDEKECPRCGRALAGATATKLSRYLRGVIPEGAYKVTLVFTALNVVLYLVMLMRSGGMSALAKGPSLRVTIRFGAWVIPLVARGEWWRLVMPIFLHFGLLHLIFNSLWLVQLGPLVEEIFGRSRFLFFYLVSGVGGFVVSIGYRIFIGDIGGVGGGASGVVFGLIGAALVVGYIRKPASSQAFRGGMVRWAIYALIFSFIPGVDLAAHLGGAVTGAVLALVLATKDQARRLSDRIWIIIEILCWAVIVGAFVLTAVKIPMILKT